MTQSYNLSQLANNLNTAGQLDATDGLSGAVPAANGGTGQSAYTVGDILYASGTTALAKLSDVATGNVLISGGVGSSPSYGKVGLTTHISGTLAVPNGGTGLSTITANALLVGAGTSTVTTISPGTSGQILASDGTSWVATNNDFTNSKTTNGYQKLPSGLIIQWGTSASVGDGSYATVTFPIAFPTACLNASATNSSSAGGNVGGTTISNITTTTMRVGHYNGGLNSSPIFWMAIGY
jgi:hypothetical protein